MGAGLEVPAFEMDDCELDWAGWPLGICEWRLVELFAPTDVIEARVAESATTTQQESCSAGRTHVNPKTILEHRTHVKPKTTIIFNTGHT